MVDALKPAAFSGLRQYRRATARLRLLPAFLVIGTQPAGVVPLFNELRRHPDIVGPFGRQPNVASPQLHFFEHEFSKGVNWYRSFFPLAFRRTSARRRGRDLLAGEATASYIFRKAAPRRVAATIPDVRLVALLRDPIERTYAHYEIMRRRGVEPLSFEEALAAEDERTRSQRERRRRFRSYAYVARSLYADQLTRWLKHFGREQLLVLRAEDFIAEPAAVYAQVLDFLGLPHYQKREIQVPEWPPAPIDPILRARLEELFAEPNAHLYELLGQDLDWPAAKRSAAASG